MEDRRILEKIDLKNSIKAFYRTDDINIKDEEIKINPELNSIIDAFCRRRKFQIKNVPGKDKGMFSLMEKGKLETVSGGCDGFEEFKEKFIKEQLRRPVSGAGIILLLWANSPFLFPLNRKVIMKIINEDKELIKLSQKSGYEEIYLLDLNQKIKVYSKN